MYWFDKFGQIYRGESSHPRPEGQVPGPQARQPAPTEAREWRIREREARELQNRGAMGCAICVGVGVVGSCFLFLCFGGIGFFNGATIKSPSTKFEAKRPADFGPANRTERKVAVKRKEPQPMLSEIPPWRRERQKHGERHKAGAAPVRESSKEKTDRESFPATKPADHGTMGQPVAHKKPLAFEVETSILQPGMNAKHQRPLEAGNTYTIDLISSEFDPLLRLLDGNGKEIDLDDDGGQGQNSRIIWRPTRTAVYHLEVKSVSKPAGSYALIIDKNTQGSSKLPNIMTHFFSGAHRVQSYPCNMKEDSTYTLEVMSSEFPPYLGLASNRLSPPFIKDLGRTNGWTRLFYRARRTGEFAAMVWPWNRGAYGYFTLIYYEGHKKTPLFPNLKTFFLPAGRKSFKIPGVWNRGSTYRIDLVSSEFDPYLRLLDEQGQEVAADDNSGHGDGARIVFKPNHTSGYWLEVNSFTESNEIQRFAWNVEENGPDIAYLPGLRTGRLQARQESKKYKWYLAATDTYTINAISTDFAPALRLLDSSNKELLADNNGQKDRYAQIVWRPRSSGIYELEVSSLRGATGSFVLIAEKK